MPLMTTNESLEVGEGVFDTWNKELEFAYDAHTHIFNFTLKVLSAGLIIK